MPPRRMTKAYIVDRNIAPRVRTIINPETGNRRVVTSDKPKPSSANKSFSLEVKKTKPNKFKNISCYTSNSSFGDKVINLVANSLDLKTKPVSSGPVPGLNINFGILRGSEMLLKKCIEKDFPYLYIDHAYFNSGHETQRPCYRMTINGLQQTELLDVPSDRFDALNIRVKPWRKNGSYIVVCPPTESVMNFYGNWNWLEKTIAKLKQFTDRRIVIRHKPDEVKIKIRNGIAHPVGKEQRKADKENAISPPALEYQLSNAWAVVTFASSAAITSAINGVPVFCDKVCASSPIGLQDLSRIETPACPDRTQWLYTLAYSQFYVDEIANGLAWKILGV